MKCICGISTFLLALSLLFTFIALSMTSWIIFRTKSDLSLLLQWTGLYQTCRYGDTCDFDLWLRSTSDQIVFFVIVGSSAVMIFAFLFLLLAEFKAKTNFYFVSGIASIFAGFIIASSNILFSVNVNWELEGFIYQGLGSFSYCYYLSWAAVLADVISGSLAISLKWTKSKS